MRKLQSIEEAAKFSDIPAAQRKKDHPHGWKTSLKDLEAEEKEGKISHKDNLAKNSGRKVPEEVQEQMVDVAAEIPSGEEPVAECGDDMAQQGGNVTMSMQDLLALMSQLQKGQVGAHDTPLMGDDDIGEEYGNSMQGDAGPEVMPVAAVTPTGNDMFSKGKEAPKVNGGGNPMAEQLAELYADVKARQLDELSKGTLASYTKKAADNVNDKAYLSGHAAAKGNNSSASANDTKAYKRLGGINKAVDKMSLKEANQMARQLRK